MGATTIDTGTNDLLANLDAGVLTLTLNRPEARNAMTGAMTTALASQLAWAEFDRAVKCVVLTGAGVSAASGLSTFRGADGKWQHELLAVSDGRRIPEMLPEM